jgi:hypothetical protein
MIYHFIVMLYVLQVIHYVTSQIHQKDNMPILSSSIIVFSCTLLELLK